MCIQHSAPAHNLPQAIRPEVPRPGFIVFQNPLGGRIRLLPPRRTVYTVRLPDLTPPLSVSLAASDTKVCVLADFSPAEAMSSAPTCLRVSLALLT
jgi:hypothetical protein